VTTHEKTHLLVVWALPDTDVIRAATDDTGRVVLFATQPVCNAFCDQLETHNIAARSLPVSSRDIAELLAYNGDIDEDNVVIVEAQATSLPDAKAWASELADRVATGINEAFKANT
jgi:hypothetical protein